MTVEETGLALAFACVFDDVRAGEDVAGFSVEDDARAVALKEMARGCGAALEK